MYHKMFQNKYNMLLEYYDKICRRKQDIHYGNFVFLILRGEGGLRYTKIIQIIH